MSAVSSSSSHLMHRNEHSAISILTHSYYVFNFFFNYFYGHVKTHDQYMYHVRCGLWLFHIQYDSVHAFVAHNEVLLFGFYSIWGRHPNEMFYCSKDSFLLISIHVRLLWCSIIYCPTVVKHLRYNLFLFVVNLMSHCWCNNHLYYHAFLQTLHTELYVYCK